MRVRGVVGEDPVVRVGVRLQRRLKDHPNDDDRQEEQEGCDELDRDQVGPDVDQLVCLRLGGLSCSRFQPTGRLLYIRREILPGLLKALAERAGKAD